MVEVKEFSKKTVVLSGASRGIGAATAVEFAALGANLVLGYRNDSSKQQETAKIIEQFGIDSVWVKGDISKPETSKELCSVAVEKFKGIDIVIANAGIAHYAPFAKISNAELSEIIGINQLGVFYLLKESVRYMKKQKSGIVVTISSTFASRVPKMNAVYAGTKAFVEAITKGFSLEYAGYGIRANVLAPGVTETDMNRVILMTSTNSAKQNPLLEQIAQPNEIAKGVTYLCSDKAPSITGQVVRMEGGSLVGI